MNKLRFFPIMDNSKKTISMGCENQINADDVIITL